MKNCSTNLPESKFGMSNYDHSIDDGMEEDLRSGMRSKHAGWDFNGDVWFEDDRFHEAVNQYHSHVATISADTLRELMNEVNAEYGTG